jgi:hypothetical protein
MAKMYSEKLAIERAIRGGAVIGNKSISAKDVGINTWGAVDYLVKHCGFSLAK